MGRSISLDEPASQETSLRMAKIPQKGTEPEVSLRRELYRSGLRYRVDFVVLRKPRRVADIAFPRLKVAVFVDGCFWHGCPIHATWPKRNAEFWRQKIEANRLRDADTTARLRDEGWTVLRIWEHEAPSEASKSVIELITVARSCLREVPATPTHEELRNRSAH